jgi:spore coat protein U-like protein
MLKKLVPIAVIFGLAATPALSSARIQHLDNGSQYQAQQYTVSLTVDPDCSLAVSPTTDTFPNVSGLGWSAENGQTAPQASGTCAAHSVTSYVYDNRGCGGGTNFCLSTSPGVLFNVCSQAGGGGTCWQNSNSSGQSVTLGNNGAYSFSLYDYLLASNFGIYGAPPLGTYTDTVNVALSFQ